VLRDRPADILGPKALTKGRYTYYPWAAGRFRFHSSGVRCSKSGATSGHRIVGRRSVAHHGASPSFTRCYAASSVQTSLVLCPTPR
jgi:hypothetical protein